MPDVPSFDDLFRVARDELLSRNANLTAAVVQTPGSETNIFTAAAAAVGDECIGQLALVTASLFLDSAEGQNLDRLVFDRFGLVRKQAAPAIGSVNFFLPTPSAGSFALPVGIILKASDGRQYVTTASATFPAGSSGPIIVAVRSTLAGLAQQAAARSITSISSVVPGAPAGLAVTNLLATAGATDAENDDSLRARARQFFTTARRGTLGAIQAAALAVDGVVTATAFELLDAFGRPARGAYLAISDQFTDSLLNITPTPTTYQTQSQILASDVFTALDEYRAAGIFVFVQVASVVLLGIQLGLRFTSGANIPLVTLNARSAIAMTVNALAPGQTFSVQQMISVLRGIPGLVVTGDEIVSPSGDVLAQQLQVFRTTPSLVLAVAQQPDQQIQSTSNPDIGR